MTFSGYYLKVFNFQKVLVAARKGDAIAYFPILTDAKTCSHYLGEIQVWLIFTLNFIYQRHYRGLELRNLYSLKPPYLQKYVDAAAEKGAPLYNCFGFVGGLIACICIPVLNERVVYNHDTRVHGVKFQTVVLPNGLIIKLEGQWEGRKHDCVLCFINQVFVFIWKSCLTNLCISAGSLPPKKLN